ncbi:MAG: hypothetical protein M3Z56_07975 [Bacteroidota bacterium]|nr:hypothetical protein [Bacteroidota bacterium]
MKKIIPFLILQFCVINFCYSQQHKNKEKEVHKMKMENIKPLDIPLIEKITGMKGKQWPI